MKKLNRFNKSGRENLPLEQLDVLIVLEEAGISYRTTGANVATGWVGVCCPFCGDGNYHLGVNIISKRISCWKCGTTGTILRLISEELRSFPKALELVKRLAPRELKLFTSSELDRKINQNLRVELPKNAKTGISEHHAAYLIKRGFDPKYMVDKYNLHHTGPTGVFPNRIIVPVTRNSVLLTFTSVSIADEVESRYKHLSNEFSRVFIKDYLYNLDSVTRGVVYVVEGLFDCWRIGDGAVPTFGTKVTDAQVKLLSKIPNVVILFDGDHAGRIGGQTLGEKLAPFTNVVMIPLPEGKDPDTLSPVFIQHIKNMRL